MTSQGHPLPSERTSAARNSTNSSLRQRLDETDLVNRPQRIHVHREDFSRQIYLGFVMSNL